MPGSCWTARYPSCPASRSAVACPRHGDLAGQPADQLPQRGHLPGIRLGQRQLIQPLRSPGAEDVRAGHLDAELGQHAVDLVLAAGADMHQLAAVPGDLPQLADLRRGDPRLRQPAHPQQVSQVPGVELVVLDPAVAEGLHTQRVRQVHLGASVRQRVRRPVPAVAGLQHHLGVQARPPDLRRQPRRAVGDPRRAELLAVLGHPDQYRPAAVQVHAHDLRAVVRFHKGPPIVVDDVDTPEHEPSGQLRGAGGPAPSWHQEPWARQPTTRSMHIGGYFTQVGKESAALRDALPVRPPAQLAGFAGCRGTRLITRSGRYRVA